MNEPNQSEVRTALSRLKQRVTQEITCRREQGLLHSNTKPVYQMSVKEFEYNEGGISRLTKSPTLVTKEMWDVATGEVFDVIEETEEYRYAYDHCNDIWHSNIDLSNGFRFFVLEIIKASLTLTEGGDEKVNELIERYLDELVGAPLPFHTTAQIVGIVVVDDVAFEIDGLQIVVRQPCSSDFDEEISAVLGPGDACAQNLNHSSRLPSAILELKGSASNLTEQQFTVWQAVCMLRLFRVGSIDAILEYAESPRLNDCSSGMQRFTLEPFSGPERYCITKEDSEAFEKFWRCFWDKLPKEFYWCIESPTYLTIAHDRYKDSLKHDTVIERRITNAVMGLESLFSGGKERSEVLFRLGIRTAKLLGSKDVPPKGIQKTIKDAYDVRSKFLHGSLLEANGKNKLAKTYGGDVANLATTILEYLRRAILTFLFLEKPKEDIIQLIDEALISDELPPALIRIRSELPAILN